MDDSVTIAGTLELVDATVGPLVDNLRKGVFLPFGIVCADMQQGDRVFDLADDEPDPAVVVGVPEGQTIADWRYEVDDEEVTAAEMNPEHPADEQLVVVAFESALDEAWPAWEEAAPEELLDGVQAHGVTHYGFPEGRLGYRTPPTVLEAVLAEVAPEVDMVEWDLDQQVLAVEKRGDRYMIAPDGTVNGDGAFAEQLEDIVANSIERG